MVRDAESHATEDRRRKEEVEERNQADSAAYRAEKSLADLGDKVTGEQKSELEAKIADVRAALATDDVERIKSARESLEQSFHRISEALYRGAGAGAAGGPGAGPEYGAGPEQGPQGNQGDDPIEGEYKEM